MAGHSKFKNIQHRKNAQDAKRAKLFTRIVREIMTAAQISPDPDHNPRLRTAILNAKSKNLPKDRVDKALKNASDPSISDNYSEIRYEGYGPSKIAVIVEAVTDNRNRTAALVRAAFSKYGGNLGETGSVSYLFSKRAVIIYNTKVKFDDIFESAINYGAEDIIEEGDSIIIYSSQAKYYEIREKLEEEFGEPLDSYIAWIPSGKISIDNQEAYEKFNKFLEVLLEIDDVEEVYTNLKV